MRGEPNDPVRADDVVGPGTTPLLNFKKVILLRVIKIGVVIVVTRNILGHWDLDGSQVDSVVL